MIFRTIIYAPNVHTGGGYVLLRSLIASWPADRPLLAILDRRTEDRLSLSANIQILMWVKRSFTSRWQAEMLLATSSRAGDLVFCFHGLPPLLNSPGRKIVFLQNRLYFGLQSLSRFRFKTAARLSFERFVSSVFRARVDQYVVQTPSMARDLIRWHTRDVASAARPVVRILPFMEAFLPPVVHYIRPPEWDFVYVADGEAHKNHRCLLAAWQQLAKQGMKPRLALTLNARDDDLMQEVKALREQSGLHVYNLGPMSHEAVLQLYQRSRALIFPSLSESFGLPLIEAQHLGLPILASELDYVRDVCEPVQTFDPDSPHSIARAVKRFMGKQEARLLLRSPAEFWDELLQDGYP